MSSDCERWSVMRADNGVRAQSLTVQPDSVGCERGGKKQNKEGSVSLTKALSQSTVTFIFGFTKQPNKDRSSLPTLVKSTERFLHCCNSSNDSVRRVKSILHQRTAC